MAQKVVGRLSHPSTNWLARTLGPGRTGQPARRSGHVYLIVGCLTFSYVIKAVVILMVGSQTSQFGNFGFPLCLTKQRGRATTKHTKEERFRGFCGLDVEATLRVIPRG